MAARSANLVGSPLKWKFRQAILFCHTADIPIRKLCGHHVPAGGTTTYLPVTPFELQSAIGFEIAKHIPKNALHLPPFRGCLFSHERQRLVCTQTSILNQIPELFVPQDEPNKTALSTTPWDYK
jgi:hypothetical protein